MMALNSLRNGCKIYIILLYFKFYIRKKINVWGFVGFGGRWSSKPEENGGGGKWYLGENLSGEKEEKWGLWEGLHCEEIGRVGFI